MDRWFRGQRSEIGDQNSSEHVSCHSVASNSSTTLKTDDCQLSRVCETDHSQTCRLSSFFVLLVTHHPSLVTKAEGRSFLC